MPPSALRTAISFVLHGQPQPVPVGGPRDKPRRPAARALFGTGTGHRRRSDVEEGGETVFTKVDGTASPEPRARPPPPLPASSPSPARHQVTHLTPPDPDPPPAPPSGDTPCAKQGLAVRPHKGAPPPVEHPRPFLVLHIRPSAFKRSPATLLRPQATPCSSGARTSTAHRRALFFSPPPCVCVLPPPASQRSLSAASARRRRPTARTRGALSFGARSGPQPSAEHFSSLLCLRFFSAGTACAAAALRLSPCWSESPRQPSGSPPPPVPTAHPRIPSGGFGRESSRTWEPRATLCQKTWASCWCGGRRRGAGGAAGWRRRRGRARGFERRASRAMPGVQLTDNKKNTTQSTF